MAKLSKIFTKINTHEDNKVKYYAKHLVESYTLTESKKFSTEIVMENLYSQAMMYNTKQESLEFLNKVEKQINEGFMDSVKKMGKAAVGAVKKVASAVVDAWTGPYIAAIKKWNIQINKIADTYEGLSESTKPLLEIDYLIEAEEAPKEEAPKEEAPKEEAPKEEAPKEEAPKEDEPIKDNKTFLLKLLKISGVKDDGDGFYTRMNLSSDKLFGSAGNFFKFGAKFQFDFIAMLRNSTHKPANFKPMSDMEMYAYMANMTLLLSTIKAKKLIPPEEDAQSFLTEFIKPTLKYTYAMNEVINRETLESDGTNDDKQHAPSGSGASTNPMATAASKEENAPTEETPVDNELIHTFTQENPTFMKKLKNMVDKDKEVMIKGITDNDILPKDLDEIVTGTDFLENGINIAEKTKYVKALQDAGIPNKNIVSVLKYIVDDGIEDSFHRNPTLMDILGVKEALSLPGGIVSLADKIFDNTKL